MKAAGVSTSRYCRVPDSAERLVLSKDQRSSLIFPLEKIKHCWSFWQDDKEAIWSLVIWNFPNNERSIFSLHVTCSYRKTLLIFSRISIMKAAGVSTSRYCRVPDSAERPVLSKRSKKFFDFSVGKNQTYWSFDKTFKGQFDLSLFGIFQITRDQSSIATRYV